MQRNKRTLIEMRTAILQHLLKEETTYAQLEWHAKTGFRTIVDHCHELERFNFVTITHVPKHPANGRPATHVQLTRSGRRMARHYPKKPSARKRE